MKITDEDLLLELKRRFNEYKIMLDDQKKLSSELVLANKKLMESEALKTHFLSNITNEIINPFASVVGLSRNILLLEKEDWSKVRCMAKLIYSEASNLDFQFRNIFAAAKIEAGDLSIESGPADISEMMEQVLVSLRHEAEKKNIEISLTTKLLDGKFNTDGEKLRLIFINLLSNAVKFNSDNGKINISLITCDNKLVFSIEDSGIGIKEAECEIIYDRFVKGNNQINSVNPGHGIGLSVVKSLVEILSGTIELSLQQGSGTRFVVTIPQSEINTDLYFNPDNPGSKLNWNDEVF